MLYVFSGLPGTGKSTVSRALAVRLGAIWLRIDSIEATVKASHMAAADLADGGYAAARAVAADNLALGHVVIADCVNPVALTRDPWAQVARDGGHPLREVEIVCSDRDTHRRRVEARLPRGPDWRTVCARRYEPWPRPVLRFDTATQSADSVAAALLEAG